MMPVCAPLKFVVGCWLLSGLASPAWSASPEVRGTWLTTTGPNHIQSGVNTAAVMADLKGIGLNTVYVETWKNGYTNYPSPTLASLTGGPDRSTFLGTRDLVKDTSALAHREGLNYVGWFEYGLAAQFVGSGGAPSNPLAVTARDRGWLLRDQSGQYANASNGFAWMNPAVPEVRQFLISIVLEAVDRYDLDGVQFDDRLAWPREFGWDSTTATLYQQETGRSLPTNIDDSRFRTWRQGKVTLFATELYNAVKSARPELQFSVSPSITTFSETNYNAVWPAWEAAGLFDQYVPQAYRATLGEFNNIIEAQVAPFLPSDLDKLAVGIRINGSPSLTPAADVLAMIDRTRAEGAAGHSLWYSSGLRDTYASQLRTYYNVAGLGPAQNPAFGDSRSAPPIVATPVAGAAGMWQATIPEGGRFKAIAKVGNLWQEAFAVLLGPGVVQLSAPGASQLELLVDRRTSPVLMGDYNGDGVIDTADYTVWRDTLGASTPLARGADGDASGRIDSADLAVWRRNFGATLPTAGAASAVPEPGGLASLLVGCCGAIYGALRRREA